MTEICKTTAMNLQKMGEAFHLRDGLFCFISNSSKNKLIYDLIKGSAAMTKFDMFVGSFSDEPDAAVLRGCFNADNGTIEITDRFDTIRPSFLLFDDDNQTLYYSQEVSTVGNHEGGGVESIRITEDKMIRTSSQSTLSSCPCYLCKNGGFLYACNYDGGSLTEFITKDGNIIAIQKHIRHAGSGTDAKRQTKPHVHCAELNPQKTVLAVCDLGLDKVFLYPFTLSGGIITEPSVIETPAGYGPRHLLFSENGKYLYVINELCCVILVYQFENDGTISHIQTVSTRADGMHGENFCGTLQFTPDHTGIIAANRGDDTIKLFAVKNDGTLNAVGIYSTGRWPRDMKFSPDGDWLLVANQNDDSLGIYRYHMEDTAKNCDSLQFYGSQSLNAGFKPSSIAFRKQPRT